MATDTLKEARRELATELAPPPPEQRVRGVNYPGGLDEAALDAHMFDELQAAKARQAALKTRLGDKVTTFDGQEYTSDQVAAISEKETRARLKVYKERRTSRGEEPFQYLEAGKGRQENATFREQLPFFGTMFSGPEKFAEAFPVDQRQAVEDRFADSFQPAAEKMTTANKLFFETMTGQEVDDELWPAQRSAFARQRLGYEGASRMIGGGDPSIATALVDDATFYKLAGYKLAEQQLEVDTTRKVAELTRAHAIRGQSLGDAIAAAKEAAGPDWKKYESAAREGYAGVLADFDNRTITAANKLFDFAAKAEGMVTSELKFDDGQAGAMAAYGMADQATRDQMLAIVGTRAEAEGTTVENYFARLAAGVGGGTNSFARALASGTQRREAEDIRKLLEGGKLPEGTTPDRSASGILTQLAQFPEDDKFNATKTRDLTPEERKEWEARAIMLEGYSTFLTDTETAGIKVRRYLDGKREGFWDTLADTTVLMAESLPIMAAAIVPYGGGIVLAANGYAEKNLSTLRREAPDADLETLKAAAFTSGFIEAGIDRLQILTLGARMPKLNAALLKYGKPGLAGVIAVQAVTKGSLEFSQEIAQDLTLPQIQEFASALTEDIPGPNWKEVFQREADALGDIARVSFGFGIIGGAGSSITNYMEAGKIRETLQDRAGLELAGIDPVDVTRIADLAETNPAAAAETLKAAIIETPVETRAANSQAAVAKLEAEALMTTGNQDAGLPVLTKLDDGRVEISYPDRAAEIVAGPEEALEAVRGWEQEAEVSVTQANRQMIGFLEEYHRSSPETAFRGQQTGKKVSLADWAGDSRERTAQAQARVQIMLRQAGQDMGGIDLSQIPILGSSQNQSARGITSIVAKINDGGNPLTVIEEHAEGVAKWLMESSRIPEAKMIGWIRETEQKLGEPLLSDNLLALDPAARQQEIVEAWSYLAQANAVGRVADSALPRGVKAFFRAFKEFINNALKIIAEFTKLRADGMLNPEMTYWLDVAAGINEEFETENLNREMEADLEREALDGLPEVSELLKGMLPHPDTPNLVLRGEIRRLYDGIVDNPESGGSKAARTRTAKAWFLPFGEIADLDDVRTFANEKGFDFATPADMIDALDLSINYGKPQYGGMTPDANSGFETSFSIGPARVTPAQDAAYLAAVQAGDMTKAQEMVDAKARKTPFKRELWHGTTSTKYIAGKSMEGDVFAREKLEALASNYGIREWSSVANVFERWVEYGMATENGITVQDAGEARRLYEASKGTSEREAESIGFDVFSMPSEGIELGVHLGTEQQAEVFGETFRFRVDISNPLRLPDLGTWNYESVMREARKRGVEISATEYDAVFNAKNENQALRDLLIQKGFDGIVYRNEAEGTGDSYIALKPSQIKSADPVTRDEAGNVIPLSERFNPADDRISFSISLPTDPSFSIGGINFTPTAETRLFEGAEGSPSVIGPASFSIRAHHGTPHKVDKFTTAKMGTGEGAQAYGWGLYFAQLLAVAAEYAERLGAFYQTKGNLYTVNLKATEEDLLDYDGEMTDEQAAKIAPLFQGNGTSRKVAFAYRELSSGAGEAYGGGTPELASRLLASVGIKGIRFLDGNSRATTGGEIIGVWQGEASQMEDRGAGDWFARVRVSNRSLGFQNSPATGFTTSPPFKNREAAQQWAEAKIQQGSYNYVIFDDADIEILEENGQPVSLESFSITLPTDPLLAAIPRVFIRRPTSGIVATEATLLPGGRIEVVIPSSDWNSRVSDVIDDALLGLTEKQGIFWRGTNNKSEPDIVEGLISKNHADGRSEGGVSVSRRLGLFAYNYYYSLTGDVAGTGSDGEPVLRNAKALGKVLTLKKARELHDKNITKRLQEIGWTREQYRNAFNGKWEKVEQPFNQSSPAASGESFGITLPTDPLLAAIAARIQSPEKRAEVFQKMRDRVREVKARFETLRLSAAYNTDQRFDQVRFEQARDLAVLEAVAKALPPELRGKLTGSFRKISDLRTTKARGEYIQALIPKIETALEKHIASQFRAAIRREMDRGAIKVSEARTRGGKIGAAGHAIFEQARKAMTFTPGEADVIAEKLTAQIEAAGEMTLERLEELDGMRAATELFADYENADSVRLEEALQLLKGVYAEGRKEWLDVLMARRALREQRVAKLREGLGLFVVDDMGVKRPSYIDRPDRSRAKREGEGALASLNEGIMAAMLSGSQKLRRLGELSDDPEVAALVEEIEQAFATAENVEADRNAADNIALAAALREILGVSTEYGLAKRLRELSDGSKDAPVDTVEGFKEEDVKVPKTIIESLLRREVSGFTDPKGNRVELDETDIADLEKAWEQFQELEDDKQAARRTVTFTRRTAKGSRVGIGPVSMLEGLQLWLTMRQSDQATKLEAMGYDAATLSQLQAWLPADVQALGLWMVEHIGKDAFTVDTLHRQEKGVGLPLVESYFPVRNNVSRSDNTGAALDGQPPQQSGRNVSFIKERVVNRAEPALVNALAVFLAHRAQSNFWISHVTAIREWGGVLKDESMADAIRVRMGEKYYQSLQQLMKRIESGGSLAAGQVNDFERVIKRMMKSFSLGTLGLRVSTLMVNTTAALNAAFEIPAGTLLRGMMEVSKRPAAFRDAWNSPAIQRRIRDGASFEAALAKSSGPSKQPILALLDSIAEKGVAPINYIDTGANLIAAAAVWEHTRLEATRAGLDPDAAKAAADRKVEIVLRRTAQPTGRLARSEIEQRALDNPMSALFALFISEPRKNFALTYLAARELLTGKGTYGKQQAAQQLVMGLVFYAVAEYIVRSFFAAWAGAKDDEEDTVWERFKARMTDPKAWAHKLATGHLTGIPVFGQGWNAAMSLASDQPVLDSSPNPLFKSVAAIDKLGTAFGKDDSEGNDPAANDQFDAAVKAAQGLGSVLPGGALFAQLGNVADFGEGVIETDAEKLARYKARFGKFTRELPKAGDDKSIQQQNRLLRADWLKGELAPLTPERRKQVLEAIDPPESLRKLID